MLLEGACQVRLAEWDAGFWAVAVSLSATVKVPTLVPMVSLPVWAVLAGWALIWPVALWPLVRVNGTATGGMENALFEKDTLVILMGVPPAAVMVKGWEETLPLLPLKLSAVVESLRLGLLLAHEGAAISIAARGRKMALFTTTAPGVGDWGLRVVSLEAVLRGRTSLVRTF